MTMPETTRPRYISCAETAKLVRSALKTAFPGITFSVRSSTYSMGASIDVGWTDGPTERQVTEVTDPFRRSDFDGRDDSTTNRPDTLLDGEMVRFGADFITGTRRLSPEFVQLLTDDIEQGPDDPGNRLYDTDIATRVRRESVFVSVTGDREVRRVES